MKTNLTIFEEYEIRRIYDEDKEMWFFSVIDIIQALTQQADYQTARKYWNKLKERLKAEGSETVTNCHQLKMLAQDGKQRLTDVATAETLLRLVQSVPSPKAEPIKLWLAKVGYERMQEMADPARSLEPVQSLFKSNTKKASTTICKLVLIFLSQFFHNHRHFSNQPNDLSTTQRFGITANLCNSLRLATSTVAPIMFFISVENFSPV